MRILKTKFFLQYKHSIVNFILALLWFAFLYRHVKEFFTNTSVMALIFLIMETFIVLLFLTRKKASEVSFIPSDWCFAFIGTFAGMLLAPSAYGLMSETGVIILYVGTVSAVVSYASLNFSFGVVPANRGIKTGGLYKFVRHPMYLSYVFIYIGYILIYTSVINSILVITFFTAMIFRIFSEERLLINDSKYTDYAKKSKWRLLPYVF